ncbi:C-3 sterol dehydrogenase [Coprinopsis cinerea AmutBmut pab1-1]|nr:C-3 sterol dehydrogenase [Coprinopsis cinerea AmutBmut pab1-1]
MASLAIAAGCLAFSFWLYIWLNDHRVNKLPDPIRSMSLQHLTPQEVRDELRTGGSKERELEVQLPPSTGRKYIVVGGGGFLGGWIVAHLLRRGEDPKRIRVVDLAPKPTHPAVLDAMETRGLQYITGDITSAKSIESAFSASWKDGAEVQDAGITVFNTAASIRFFERHTAFLSRSTPVNVLGTRNVLNACRTVGADVLIYTSSAGVGTKSVSLLQWPWKTSPPKDLCQFVNEDPARGPRTPDEYASNYSITKGIADNLVRDFDRTSLDNGKMIRTGCIRAGNGIYGVCGSFAEAHLSRSWTPQWLHNVVHSFVHVENCSLAHLLYERRLLDVMNQAAVPSDDPASASKPLLPDIGGQAFCITDPGPPIYWNDMYTIFETLTAGRCYFPYVSPTFVFLIAHLIELYYLLQYFATTSFPVLKSFLPPITGEISYLQPAALGSSNVHIIVDDSKARKSPEEGGLGYKGVWTTREGFRRMWEQYEKMDRKASNSRWNGKVTEPVGYGTKH